MAIERRPSFNSKTFLARVGKGRSVREYRKGQIVFSQGEPADAVFYIQKGKVKLTVVSEQGKEAVVAILGTDDFFGEGCLAGQHQRIATVTTMADAIITRLAKPSIVRLISSISYSIRARNVLPECFCCWRTSVRTANRNPSSPRSARKPLRR